MVLDGIRESVKSKVTGKTWEISGLKGNSWIPIFETKGKKPSIDNIVKTSEYRKYRLMCLETGKKEWEITNFEFEKGENKAPLQKGQSVSNEKSTELEQIEKIMTFLKTMKGDIKDELMENLKITEKRDPIKTITEQIRSIKDLKDEFGIDLEKSAGEGKNEGTGKLLRYITEFLKTVSDPQVQQAMGNLIGGIGSKVGKRTELSDEAAGRVAQRYMKEHPEVSVPKPPPPQRVEPQEPKPQGETDE